VFGVHGKKKAKPMESRGISCPSFSIRSGDEKGGIRNYPLGKGKWGELIRPGKEKRKEKRVRTVGKRKCRWVHIFDRGRVHAYQKLPLKFLK